MAIRNRDYRQAIMHVRQNLNYGMARNTHPPHGNDGTVPDHYGRDLISQVIEDMLDHGEPQAAIDQMVRELENIMGL